MASSLIELELDVLSFETKGGVSAVVDAAALDLLVRGGTM